MANPLRLCADDALLIIDVQNDFLPPDGSLAVPHGNEIIPVLNSYLTLFTQYHLPIYVSRDWHPANHCSFNVQGGPWPAHCVQNTKGAQFSFDLHLPHDVNVISKATTSEREACSAFKGTNFSRTLQNHKVKRLFVGGLATEYCVADSVRDALEAQFCVYLLTDAIRAINAKPGDGEKAIHALQQTGAHLIQFSTIIGFENTVDA